MAALLHRLKQEPTSYFVLIAAFLLILPTFFNDEDETSLQIDRRVIDGRILVIEMRSGNSLTADEKKAIEDEYINEQILVREARLLGLENDRRINELLMQKVRHVLSGDVIQPGPEDLQNYYDLHKARYLIPTKVTLDELVLRSMDPLPNSVLKQFRDGEAVKIILANPALKKQQTKIETMQSRIAKIDSVDLNSIFTPAISMQVMNAQIYQWVGPHLTTRGQHWLRIAERFEANTPGLHSIRDRVRLDWVADEEDSRFEQYLLGLRQRTIIEFTGERLPDEK